MGIIRAWFSRVCTLCILTNVTAAQNLAPPSSVDSYIVDQLVLEQTYRGMWQKTKQLAQQVGETVPPPRIALKNDDIGVGLLSLPGSIPPATRQRVVHVMKRLRGICPELEVNDPLGLHITLFDLSPGQSRHVPSFGDTLATKLSKLCADCPPFDITLRGVNMGPDGGIFVEGHVTDSTPFELRRRIAQEFGISQPRPNIIHITIGRLTEQTDAESFQELVSLIENKFRTMEFGTMHVESARLALRVARVLTDQFAGEYVVPFEPGHMTDQRNASCGTMCQYERRQATDSMRSQIAELFDELRQTYNSGPPEQLVLLDSVRERGKGDLRVPQSDIPDGRIRPSIPKNSMMNEREVDFALLMAGMIEYPDFDLLPHLRTTVIMALSLRRIPLRSNTQIFFIPAICYPHISRLFWHEQHGNPATRSYAGALYSQDGSRIYVSLHFAQRKPDLVPALVAHEAIHIEYGRHDANPARMVPAHTDLDKIMAEIAHADRQMMDSLERARAVIDDMDTDNIHEPAHSL